MDKRTTITIGDKTFVVEADDLETICILGRGAYGIVDKVRHKQSGTIMAVKVMYMYIIIYIYIIFIYLYNNVYLYVFFDIYNSIFDYKKNLMYFIENNCHS